ncbi:MAG: TonB-dependent receptor plug domain-containing protein [Limisphaerales bacterium]
MNKRNFLLAKSAVVSAGSCILLCFCISVLSTRADDTNQPDLTEMSLSSLMKIQVPEVTTASKFEQPATQAPSSVTVITSDEIKRYGWRTLGDILASVQGFDISYDRDYDYVGASGVNLGDFNSRILLLINGHRINNDLNDSAYVDTAFLLDVDLIDRVEIVHGPGSVLYGNNAFLGVINVITRQENQVNGVEVSGMYGSYNAWSGRVTIGDLFTNGFANGLQFLLSGTLYNDDGPENLFYPQFDTPSQNNGVAHKMDGDGFGSFFGSINYQDFTLEGGYIDRNKVNPTAQYGTTFDDSRFRTDDDRSYATLKYGHKFSDTLDLSANVYYDRSDYQVELPGPLFAPAPGSILDEVQETGQWAGGEVQLNKTIWDRHIITVGAEYRDDFQQDANSSQLEPTYTNYPSVHDQRENVGVFAQGDFLIVTNLHLETGVRFDQSFDDQDHFSPSWSPRAALVYQALPQSTFKFIYGTAFRDPSFYELSEISTANIKPEPEDITSYELVYEQGIGKYLRSSIAGYYDHLHNLIAVQQGYFTNFNANTMGTELALEGKWNYGIMTRASYTLLHSEDRETGGGLPDSPMHMLKFNASVPLYPDKIFAGLEVQYTSRSQTVTYTDASGGYVPGYTVVNFTLFSQNLIKNLELSASVYNLLDKTYYEPASQLHLQNAIQQDGRTFWLKLTYRF